MDSTKTEKLAFIDVHDEEQWAGNPPPAYAANQVELKTVLPLASSSSVYQCQQTEPPMREIYRSIFTLALCFWPFGIVAMIKAIKGMKAHYNGDIKSANAYRKSALCWNIAAIVIGSIIISGLIQALVRTTIVVVHKLAMNDSMTDCTNSTLAMI